MSGVERERECSSEVLVSHCMRQLSLLSHRFCCGHVACNTCTHVRVYHVPVSLSVCPRVQLPHESAIALIKKPQTFYVAGGNLSGTLLFFYLIQFLFLFLSLGFIFFQFVVPFFLQFRPQTCTNVLQFPAKKTAKCFRFAQETKTNSKSNLHFVSINAAVGGNRNAYTYGNLCKSKPTH